VAGTIYEAIHYAVFSNFLLLSGINYKDWTTLFQNSVYSLSSIPRTKCHTHSDKNTT